MSSKDAYVKEICDLLKIWHSLEHTVWPGARGALEYRINQLVAEGGI